MRLRRPQDLAAAVHEARRRFKLTQAELARRIGVNREWVVRLEAGEPGVALGLVMRTLSELGLGLALEKDVQPTRKASRRRSGAPPISIDQVVDD